MFLPMFRVVVVALVLCALVVSAVPASAGSLRDGQGIERAESDWFQVALAWLSSVFEAEAPAPDSTTVAPDLPMNGSCIDPFGRCA